MTPYDTDEVCEPKPWLDNDTVNIGQPNWGFVDFDESDGFTTIAQLRVTPSTAYGKPATMTFAANVNELIVRDTGGARIRIVDTTQPHDLDSLHAKINQAQRAIDQASDSGDDPATQLSDTLASLLHWADANGVDFEQAIESAERCKAAELADWGA
jgi:hypothetical protein